MQIKTDEQRDALVRALTNEPTPMQIQNMNTEGTITIFSGVGTAAEGTIRVTVDGRIARR